MELLLAGLSLLLSSFVMLAGLFNTTANLGFFLGLGLIPINIILVTDIYSRTATVQSNFSLRDFLSQDSALFFITLGLILLSFSLIVVRNLFLL